MTALPPIGTRVRCKTTGRVGTVTADWGRTEITDAPYDIAWVRWPQGGGAWFTADEIEELTDNEAR